MKFNNDYIVNESHVLSLKCKPVNKNKCIITTTFYWLVYQIEGRSI